MKLPEKPPAWQEIFNKEGPKVIKLLNERKLFEKIAENNKEYYYWDELRYRSKDDLEQKYIWTFMKFLRSQKYERIPLSSIPVKYGLTPGINRRLHLFDKFLAGNIEVQTENLGLEKRYIISSLREEAIASSILEGAATTRKEAKEMLKTKRKPRSRGEWMVLNAYETMQIIVRRQKEKLSPEFLLEIQASITKNTLEKKEDIGRLRDTNDIIVADRNDPNVVYHIPPDHKQLPGLVKELCDYANTDNGDFIHPIIKGAILHFLIGYIHPFNDGNGRTARSIFYWYMLSRGYWLIEYTAVSRRILRSRKTYSLAYLHSEYDELDTTYFIKYITECIEDSLSDLMAYTKRKQAEQLETKKIVETLKDLNYRQASILEEMMKNPGKHFTISEISETYNVVYQTARTDLLYLADKGRIKMVKLPRKFVFYFDDDQRNKITAQGK